MKETREKKKKKYLFGQNYLARTKVLDPTLPHLEPPPYRPSQPTTLSFSVSPSIGWLFLWATRCLAGGGGEGRHNGNRSPCWSVPGSGRTVCCLRVTGSRRYRYLSPITCMRRSGAKGVGVGGRRGECGAVGKGLMDNGGREGGARWPLIANLTSERRSAPAPGMLHFKDYFPLLLFYRRILILSSAKLPISSSSSPSPSP